MLFGLSVNFKTNENEAAYLTNWLIKLMFQILNGERISFCTKKVREIIVKVLIFLYIFQFPGCLYVLLI